MAKKKEEKVGKALSGEDTRFRNVPLKELKDHPELHEAYGQAYGSAALHGLLKE